MGYMVDLSVIHAYLGCSDCRLNTDQLNSLKMQLAIAERLEALVVEVKEINKSLKIIANKGIR